MVKASSDMTASPYEVQEIDFLTTLCEKIRHDHSLVLLYIKVFNPTYHKIAIIEPKENRSIISVSHY